MGKESVSLCMSQVGFRKGGVDILGRRTQLEVLLSVLLLAALLALLACLLVLGLGFSSGNKIQQMMTCLRLPLSTLLYLLHLYSMYLFSPRSPPLITTLLYFPLLPHPFFCTLPFPSLPSCHPFSCPLSSLPFLHLFLSFLFLSY